MGVTNRRTSGAVRVVFARYGVPWTRQGQRLLIAGLLALLATTLLLLADAAGAVPASLLPHTPLHARNAHAMTPNNPLPPVPDPSPTIPPTATPQPKVPVITLVSPSAGQGPVGAHVSISGHDFSSSTPTIYASSQQDCTGSQGTLATPRTSGGSFGTTTFIWPTNLGNSTYYICADGLTSNAPSYQVLSSAPPTLSLSVSTAAPGDNVTITGSNFVGYSGGTNVSITESSGGTPLTLSGATLGPDGSFSVTETLSKTIIGNNVTINAYSPPERAGLQPVLQASASLTVQSTTPTPIIAVTPTQGVSGNTTSTPNNTNQKSGNTGLVVLLIVGIVLALLVILGVVAYLVLRGRNEGEPGAAGDQSGGGFGGFGGASSGQRSTGPVPGFGQGATGRYSQLNQYGHSGVFDPNAYTEPFAGQAVGGVSQWDEPTTSPGADWQPRPMTGYGQADGDTQQNPYDQYSDYPVGAPQQPVRQGTYPPVDPWDAPANQSIQPGRSSNSAYPPNTNLGGATGRTRATGPVNPSAQPYPQPNNGWGDRTGDGGWGGSGVTRPGSNGPVQHDQPPGNEPGW